MKYLVLVLLLSGCMPRRHHHTNTFQVSPDLLPYVLRFEAEALKRGKTIKIQDLIASGVLAYCVVGTDSPTIKIVDRDWFDHTSDASREHVVFHELGHCILGRDHNDAQEYFGPSSLMNTYMFDDETYLMYHDWYLDELFR
jgi:hypothetical protein